LLIENLLILAQRLISIDNYYDCVAASYPAAVNIVMFIIIVIIIIIIIIILFLVLPSLVNKSYSLPTLKGTGDRMEMTGMVAAGQDTG